MKFVLLEDGLGLGAICSCACERDFFHILKVLPIGIRDVGGGENFLVASQKF